MEYKGITLNTLLEEHLKTKLRWSASKRFGIDELKIWSLPTKTITTEPCLNASSIDQTTLTAYVKRFQTNYYKLWLVITQDVT
jgi:ferrous iron transport protein B